MANQDLFPASVVAIICFALFAVFVALIISIINLLVLAVHSLAFPDIPSDNFYSQVKDLMISDLLPST